MTAGTRIDLNVDVGEGFPWDNGLLALATSANVCAGVHAGSPGASAELAAQARGLGLAVGVHPGYDDPATMGRAALPPDRVESETAGLVGQCRAAWAEYVKPHGAFYNQSAAGGAAGAALELCLLSSGLPLYGLPGSFHERAAAAAGVRFVAEGFAERGYRADGTLVPRGEPGDCLGPDEAAAQALSLAGRVETLCVHGDRPDCVAVLRLVRRALQDSGVEVRRCV